MDGDCRREHPGMAGRPGREGRRDRRWPPVLEPPRPEPISALRIVMAAGRPYPLPVLGRYHGRSRRQRRLRPCRFGTRKSRDAGQMW